MRPCRLKAGHILPPTSDQGQAIEFFAKRVKELTNGEIEIQVFHAGELGKSIPSQLENLVSGAQDLFIDTFDYFKAWDPRFGVVNTPVRVPRPRPFQEIPRERPLRRHGRLAGKARRRVPRQGQLQLAARRRSRAAHANADHEAGGPEGLQDCACSRRRRRSRRGRRSAPISRSFRGRTPTRRSRPEPSTGSPPCSRARRI